MVARLSFVLITLMFIVGCTSIEALITEIKPVTQSLVGDPIRGAELFQVGVGVSPPCSTCHRIGQDGYGMSLAPDLKDIISISQERDSTITPEEYIRISILDPQQFVVSGFRVSMYPDYAQHLSEQDIADIIAYLINT